MERREIINHFRNCATRVKAGNINRKGAVIRDMIAARRVLVLKKEENKVSKVIMVSDRVVKRI